MSAITLQTTIDAPIERCFLLSLSVDLHKKSTSTTNETAIAGITKGIMYLGDDVTWEANHFGFKLHMTTKISAYNKPIFFVSEMVKGPFKKLYHQHLFEYANNKTIMTDIFELKAPLGFLGTIAERLFLTNYMKKFLILRNNCIKETAEGQNWVKFIS